MKLSAIALFAGWALGAAVIVSEWIRYLAASVQIDRVARSEGGRWSLLDSKQLVRFVYFPGEIITADDSLQMRLAKSDLLRLRSRMWKIICLAVSFQILGFLAAVAVALWETEWLS